MSATTKSIFFIPSILILSYLAIGFIPNLSAVDKIAPQWLAMTIINLTGLIFLFINRNNFSVQINSTLKSTLSITYLVFITWAAFSYFYSINPTEVLVNIARQVNVLLMYLILGILIYDFPLKIKFISWVIFIYLVIEVYAVLVDAQTMLSNNGQIIGNALKGVTANRNITAFSIVAKIPFTLFLLHSLSKNLLKGFNIILIFLSLVCISMIQSRAAYLAVGFILLSYSLLNIKLYLEKRKRIQLFKIGNFLIPLLLAIVVNQTFLSSKGADAISRAATISVSKEDGSINQRLRYYEDVIIHVSSNPILGVGLGNWKLKSIEYDSKDINGYVVPYHAHSDFIQLGAELGILGFLLYLGIFIWAVYYGYRLLRYSDLPLLEKTFIFLIIISLGVYSLDANLNFPIARPQVLVIWALVIALINGYYQKTQNKIQKIKTTRKLSTGFLAFAIILLIPSVYINNSVYKSLKGQMFLLQDFNSNQFNVPLNQVDNIVPDIPNITVTTIPINSVKARYYVNAKKYDKALSLLEKGTKANPYLYYSEILKSQIFQEKGQLDSAKVYARKAFFGLPNNELHASRYINLINLTRDREALEEAFKLLTAKNKVNNWKNYLIIASSLNPPKDKNLVERAKSAYQLFPNNEEIKSLYRLITVGQAGVNAAASFSAKGLDFFNSQDYTNAAKEFEKALEANPLDYAHFENAATANYLIGNLEKAIDQINVVIDELNPLNGKCEYIKALIFIRMGDPIGACHLLATSRDSGYSQAEATFDQYCR